MVWAISTHSHLTTQSRGEKTLVAHPCTLHPYLRPFSHSSGQAYKNVDQNLKDTIGAKYVYLFLRVWNIRTRGGLHLFTGVCPIIIIRKWQGNNCPFVVMFCGTGSKMQIPNEAGGWWVWWMVYYAQSWLNFLPCLSQVSKRQIRAVTSIDT